MSATDLVVRPSYQFGPTEILTCDKLNLMATPTVELSIADRVDDQSFFRNGNFYSAYWTTPAGMSCPAGVETSNADYWAVNPAGGAVNCLRSTLTPDLNSLFSMELVGAASVTTCRVSQTVNGDLSATMRRGVIYSGYILNNAGLAISPQLEVWTANTFNNFATVTLQETVNLQTCAAGGWTYVSVGIDLTSVANVANGLKMILVLPSGALSDPSKSVNISRIKFQIGSIATEFVDDVSLFQQAPSVDSTMLQDGCIARPTLFAPSVIPTGAYQPKSINNGDINNGAIDGRTLTPAVNTTLTAAFVQPAVNASVSIAVVSTTGFILGRHVTIAVGGVYSLQSITDATHMVVVNTGTSGNAAPLANVPTSGAVSMTSAVVANLGYTPVNKAGDSGVGKLQINNDNVVGTTAYNNAGIVVTCAAANAANNGYMPSIGFHRPGVIGRALGLTTDNRLATVDSGGAIAYLLDTVSKVGTADVQDGSITLQKLAQSLIDILVPAGTIRMFAGGSPPSGWLYCDGLLYNPATYPKLFALVGTTWGGNGTSTFGVPDFRGRSPLGYVNSAGSGLTARAFASKFGEENHPLTLAELASHDHGFADNGHAHSVNPHAHSYNNPLGTQINVSGGGSPIFYPSGVLNTSSVGGTTTPSSAGITFSGQGGNAAHNNIQPSVVCLFVIKT